jgi:glycerol kinase
VAPTADFVGAVDQGTTGTRFMILDHAGNEVAKHQLEHARILPRPGWVEHDPVEIWERTNSVMQNALRHGKLSPTDLAAIGITNQRETTLVWDPRNGRPYYINAIVWQDTRTDSVAAALERAGQGDVIRHKVGLPPATYFSGGKSSGSWRTSTASARRPSKDTLSSATRTAGSCGT